MSKKQVFSLFGHSLLFLKEGMFTIKRNIRINRIRCQVKTHRIDFAILLYLS